MLFKFASSVPLGLALNVLFFLLSPPPPIEDPTKERLDEGTLTPLVVY